jgi:type IV pilus assembly protein PilX
MAYKRMDKEAGMALLVSLVFLLLLTIVGVVAMQGASLQEKMAGNTSSKNMSFQYSETLLRKAEAFIASESNADKLALNCNKCVDNCSVPDWKSAKEDAGGAICYAWIKDEATGGYYQIQNLGTATSPIGLPNGDSATMYRITAVSKSGGTTTALESIFARN